MYGGGRNDWAYDLHCIKSKDCWRLVWTKLHIERLPDNHINWCNVLQGDGLGIGDMRSFRQAVIANIAWCVWKDRNKTDDSRQIVERGVKLAIALRFKLKPDIIARERRMERCGENGDFAQ